jgi:hypothetical protein
MPSIVDIIELNATIAIVTADTIKPAPTKYHVRGGGSFRVTSAIRAEAWRR